MCLDGVKSFLCESKQCCEIKDGNTVLGAKGGFPEQRTTLPLHVSIPGDWREHDRCSKNPHPAGPYLPASPLRLPCPPSKGVPSPHLQTGTPPPLGPLSSLLSGAICGRLPPWFTGVPVGPQQPPHGGLACSSPQPLPVSRTGALTLQV